METLIFLAQGFFFYGVAFIFALLFLVFVHEYGHYRTALYYGVRVEKFSIGFGRELWGFTDKKGMRWSFALWPLGGYVQIFGDYDVQNPVRWDPDLKATRPLTPEELSVAFCTRTVWQRMAIVMAGPMINLIPAILILALVYSAYGQTSSPTTLNALDIKAAAYESGFRTGDQIIEFEGKPIRRLEDIFDRTMTEYNKEFQFKILRQGKEISLTMTPDVETYIDTKGVERKNGRTGMAFFYGTEFKEVYSVDGISTAKDPQKARDLLMERFDQDVQIGFKYREDMISIYVMRFPARGNEHLKDPQHRYYDKIFTVSPDYKYLVQLGLLESLQRTFTTIFELPLEVYKRISATLAGKNDDPIVGGIATMSSSVADSAQSGWISYLIFLCIFSVQLAILNLLPIPVLDGGYMVFLIYEALRGKPVPQKVQNYAFIIGIVILIGIMIFANVSDILLLLR